MLLLRTILVVVCALALAPFVGGCGGGNAEDESVIDGPFAPFDTWISFPADTEVLNGSGLEERSDQTLAFVVVTGADETLRRIGDELQAAGFSFVPEVGPQNGYEEVGDLERVYVSAKTLLYVSAFSFPDQTIVTLMLLPSGGEF